LRSAAVFPALEAIARTSSANPVRRVNCISVRYSFPLPLVPRRSKFVPLRKYLQVFSVGLQNTFVYRWNFFLRALFGLFPLLGTIFIWGAIFEERGSGINQFDYGSTVFYFLLVMLFDSLITPTDDEWQVATDIRDGQMNAFLVRPMNYLFYRFSLFASNRILYTCLTLPVVIGLFVVFREYLRWPSRADVWALVILSTILAALLQFLIAYSVALLAFWMLEISTIVFIIYSFEYFLSGHMFPLGIMPPAFQQVLSWLPFTYELYFPISILLGQVSGAELWRGLAIQTGWVIVMALVARRLWRNGLRHYQAVGG
jgi:viologen exporter family transport system permease protein